MATFGKTHLVRVQLSLDLGTASIPEYWIVNLRDRCLEVYRDPGPDPDAPSGASYRTRLTYGIGDSVQARSIAGEPIQVEALF